MNNKVITEEAIENTRRERGWTADSRTIFNWIKGALRLDFGKSFVSKNDVGQEILSRFPSTLMLVASAIVIAIFVTVLLGVLSALHKKHLAG